MPDTRSLGPVWSWISEENLLTKIYEMDIHTHYIPKLPFTATRKCSFYPLSKELISSKWGALQNPKIHHADTVNHGDPSTNENSNLKLEDHKSQLNFSFIEKSRINLTAETLSHNQEENVMFLNSWCQVETERGNFISLSHLFRWYLKWSYFTVKVWQGYNIGFSEQATHLLAKKLKCFST